ncbi:MAG: hypothetical protein ABIT47_04530 [Candidatus Paceibacterota bacterium]
MEITPDSGLIFIDKNIGRVKRSLFRTWLKITKNPRPGSYPYLTGDSFRALADHIYDETGKCSPSVVNRGDVVFVGNFFMREYLETIHPQIPHPYVLIQHNGDFDVDKGIADLLDDNIVRFYAQDVVYAHEKIIPIPIGIENRKYHVNGVTSMYDSFRKKIEKHPPIRKNRIFFRFSLETNPPERTAARDLFLKLPYMDTVSVHLSSKMHAKILMAYKFVASPRGNSIESSRTWEALYLKNIPIVKDYVSLVYFASIGLPIWVVKEWTELEGLSEELLAKKYDELMQNANWKPLEMDYWIERIRADQALARAT